MVLEKNRAGYALLDNFISFKLLINDILVWLRARSPYSTRVVGGYPYIFIKRLLQGTLHTEENVVYTSHLHKLKLTISSTIS